MSNIRSCVIPGFVKPKECAECPIMNEWDECTLLPKYYETFEDQYKNCPLVEVNFKRRRKI